MNLIVDTNVLVRLVTGDDPDQQRIAHDTLDKAGRIVIGLHVLCELAWVLSHAYKTSRKDVSDTIRRLLQMRNVVTRRPAVAAGLAMLDAGGDFADGMIAFEGAELGGDCFASFDEKAIKILAASDKATLLMK